MKEEEDDDDDLAFPLPSITNLCFLRLVVFEQKAKKCVEKMIKNHEEDSLVRCVATARSLGIYRECLLLLSREKSNKN